MMMMVICWLGIYRIYLSSENKEWENRSKGIFRIFFESEGSVFVSDSSEWKMKQLNKIEPDSVTFHLFEYKDSDLCNSSGHLYHFVKGTINFDRCFQKQFNYKKLQYKSGLQLDGQVLIMDYHEGYKIKLEIECSCVENDKEKYFTVENFVKPRGENQPRHSFKYFDEDQKIFRRLFLNLINKIPKNQTQNQKDEENDKLNSNGLFKKGTKNTDENYKFNWKILLLVIIIIIIFSCGIAYCLQRRKKSKKKRKKKNRSK